MNFDPVLVKEGANEIGLGSHFLWRQVKLLLELLSWHDDLALELVTVSRVLLDETDRLMAYLTQRLV